MRRFLLICLVCLAGSLRAQKLDDNITITDSSGMVYPRQIWSGLLQSGKYGLKLSQDRKSGVLVRLTEAELARRAASIGRPRESAFFRTGSAIGSFNEKDMNGNRFKLKDLAGKVVVLNFWFVNCSPCRMEMPHLNEVVAQYKDNKDVVFIAFSLDRKSDIEEMLQALPFHYNIIDNARYIAEQYKVTSYPTHVVLNREGKVLFHTSGYGTATIPWLRKAIDAGVANTDLPQ